MKEIYNELLEICCEIFEIDKELFYSNKRLSKIVMAKKAFIIVLHDDLKLPQWKIAEILNTKTQNISKLLQNRDDFFFNDNLNDVKFLFKSKKNEN
jgi:chromosomal replication initiation ATPase DnaA